MKTFERVLFLLAFVLVSVYTTRHVYRLWLEPRSSVLDEFDDEVEIAIESALQVEELLTRYRPLRDAVERLEEEHRGTPRSEWRFQDEEPFESEARLRGAIEQWEERRREVLELRVYWTLGLVGALVGLVVHEKRSRWLGLAVMVTGWSEMIYWCSPAWFSSSTAETERLLINKLVLSTVALVLLVAGARRLGLLADQPVEANVEAGGRSPAP